MSNLTPILTLNQEAEIAVTWTMSQLQARGFQVERTFDLQRHVWNMPIVLVHITAPPIVPVRWWFYLFMGLISS